MTNKESIGVIKSVDTGNVFIGIKDDSLLNRMQVNQIVKIRSTITNEWVIGLISKITRETKVDAEKIENLEDKVENLIKAYLVGTLSVRTRLEKAKFNRSVRIVPSIGANCFLLEDDELSEFMEIVSHSTENPLDIGKYTISENSIAKLDGNKFFQRHAVIVGGTGSGKSYTVANILEKSDSLQSVNSIVLDLHGEYKPLENLERATLLKIAGPADKATDKNVIFLPYWLFSYEEIEAFLLERTDHNAPNQTRFLFNSIIKHKKKLLEKNRKLDVLKNFTIDSPIPYKISGVLDDLKDKDEEMVEGARPNTEKQGPLFGKFTLLIQRLEIKKSDKRLHFLFNEDESLLEYDWLPSLIDKLFDFGDGQTGIKIIDLSEAPSDILPLVLGVLARLILSIQQWTDNEKRHPIALFCDEAHLYIPAETQDSMEERGKKSFEKIAKEGRKYGVGLVVISQRPADVSKTILSQCGNFIAMRLTNPEDQNLIKSLFPDNNEDFSELLPILDIGESLVVGDSCLLPSRVIISPPKIEPSSATVAFWDEWGKKKEERGYKDAVEALRRQKK